MIVPKLKVLRLKPETYKEKTKQDKRKDPI